MLITLKTLKNRICKTESAPTRSETDAAEFRSVETKFSAANSQKQQQKNSKTAENSRKIEKTAENRENSSRKNRKTASAYLETAKTVKTAFSTETEIAAEQQKQQK